MLSAHWLLYLPHRLLLGCRVPLPASVLELHEHFVPAALLQSETLSAVLLLDRLENPDVPPTSRLCCAVARRLSRDQDVFLQIKLILQ